MAAQRYAFSFDMQRYTPFFIFGVIGGSILQRHTPLENGCFLYPSFSLFAISSLATQVM
jgi:hypothetical protein